MRWWQLPPRRAVAIALLITAGVVARAAMQAQTPAPRPPATVQQLMQGILFPNANVIFAAEGDDPAALRRDTRPAASTNPLTGLYGGWQAVENSSLALLESAELLSVRGRVCANGKLAPIDESEWNTAVQSLRDASTAALAAARAKSQDRISTAAIQVTDSCSTCHRIYRRADSHCAR